MQDLFHYSYYLSFTDYKIKSFLLLYIKIVD
nr:MAG TPA: hypothetical protein [Caudoviricetes sp.]